MISSRRFFKNCTISSFWLIILVIMQKKRILILGGGISGLTLAYYLAKRKDLFDIQLIEKSERLGGWIDSDNSTGFFFEKGPRVFRGSKSKEFLSLSSEIGMDKEMIPCNPDA